MPRRSDEKISTPPAYTRVEASLSSRNSTVSARASATTVRARPSPGSGTAGSNAGIEQRAAVSTWEAETPRPGPSCDSEGQRAFAVSAGSDAFSRSNASNARGPYGPDTSQCDRHPVAASFTAREAASSSCRSASAKARLRSS